MNRTALCIRMIRELAKGVRLNTRTLALRLDTNPRNIREFRREIETAGIRIIEFKGPYGGYELASDQSLLIPSELTREDVATLVDAQGFLETLNYHHLHQIQEVIAKLAVQPKTKAYQGINYINQQSLSKQEAIYLDLIEQAIAQHRWLQLSYQGLEDQQSMERRVQPYDIFNAQGAYYLLAFDVQRQDYRRFRLSKSRLHHLAILEGTFIPRADYDFTQLIGQQGIVNEQPIEVELRLTEGQLQPIEETNFLDIQSQQDDLIKVLCLSPYRLFGFLFEHPHIHLVSPPNLREQFIQKVHSISEAYQNGRS